ncbi:MAG: T9SS type A sorting domain-containing protein [Bacteroidales bacterium]|nr:T9SS type A sorting domain-containing protein [Bacteroidales bacterium]
MEIIWQQCFGGSEQDIAYDIVEIPGGYFIVGATESSDGDISFNHNVGFRDGWLIKTDASGNILWEKTYGGSSGDGFRRIFPDNTGNFILVGGSGSSDGDISYDPYPDSEDFWFVKIDIDGNIIWDKIVGGSDGGEHIWNASPTLDGGVVAIGWTYSTDGDVSVSYGGADTWAVKISSEGELEWDFSIGTDWIDKGQAILATSDGGYLISSNSIIPADAIGNITCAQHSTGWMEGVLFKLDSNLNLVWQHCMGGSDSDGLFGIIEIEDGYVLSGGTASQDGDVIGWHEGYNHLGYPENDIWVVKIDFDGNIIWQKCLGGSISEYSSISFDTNDGSLVILGGTRSDNGDVSGNHSISEFDDDIWFVKISSEGELLYQKCFGGELKEDLNFGVVQKSDNNYVIAALTNYGPSYDVGCTPHGGIRDDDWWLFEIKDCTHYAPLTPSQPTGSTHACSASGEPARYTVPPLANQTHAWHLEPAEAGTLTTHGDTLTVAWTTTFEGTATLTARGVNDCGESGWSAPLYTQVETCAGIATHPLSGLRLWPNPASAIFNLQLPAGATLPASLALSDLSGREVLRQTLTETLSTIDCSRLVEGVYFWRVELDYTSVSGKLIIRGER